MARGISALHAAGIAHADIKSQNILIMHSGRAVIGDLGTAEFLPKSGMVKMQPCESDYPYWAPEYKTKGIMSRSADVYCYGIMLIELVVGRTMYSETSLFTEPIKALVADGRDTFMKNSWGGGVRDTVLRLAARCLQPCRFERPDADACISVFSGGGDVSTPTPSAKRKRDVVEGRSARAIGV